MFHQLGFGTQPHYKALSNLSLQRPNAGFGTAKYLIENDKQWS